LRMPFCPQNATNQFLQVANELRTVVPGETGFGILVPGAMG